MRSHISSSRSVHTEPAGLCFHQLTISVVQRAQTLASTAQQDLPCTMGRACLRLPVAAGSLLAGASLKLGPELLTLLQQLLPLPVPGLLLAAQCCLQ